MAIIELEAKHTKWTGADDMPAAADGTKARAASSHIGADWRNAVRWDGHVVSRVGWVDGVYDDRVEVSAPDGSVTVHRSVRAALRSVGLTCVT